MKRAFLWLLALLLALQPVAFAEENKPSGTEDSSAQAYVIPESDYLYVNGDSRVFGVEGDLTAIFRLTVTQAEKIHILTSGVEITLVVYDETKDEVQGVYSSVSGLLDVPLDASEGTYLLGFSGRGEVEVVVANEEGTARIYNGDEPADGMKDPEEETTEPEEDTTEETTQEKTEETIEETTEENQESLPDTPENEEAPKTEEVTENGDAAETEELSEKTETEGNEKTAEDSSNAPAEEPQTPDADDKDASEPASDDGVEQPEEVSAEKSEPEEAPAADSVPVEDLPADSSPEQVSPVDDTPEQAPPTDEPPEELPPVNEAPEEGASADSIVEQAPSDEKPDLPQVFTVEPPVKEKEDRPQVFTVEPPVKTATTGQPAEAASESIPETVEENIPEAGTETIPEATPEIVGEPGTDADPETIPETDAEPIPETVEKTVSEMIPESDPEMAAETIADNAHESVDLSVPIEHTAPLNETFSLLSVLTEAGVPANAVIGLRGDMEGRLFGVNQNADWLLTPYSAYERIELYVSTAVDGHAAADYTVVLVNPDASEELPLSLPEESAPTMRDVRITMEQRDGYGILTADTSAWENPEALSWQWQYSLDGETWLDLEEADTPEYTYPLNETSGRCYWRLLVSEKDAAVQNSY